MLRVVILLAVIAIASAYLAPQYPGLAELHNLSVTLFLLLADVITQILTTLKQVVK